MQVWDFRVLWTEDFDKLVEMDLIDGMIFNNGEHHIVTSNKLVILDFIIRIQ